MTVDGQTDTAAPGAVPASGQGAQTATTGNPGRDRLERWQSRLDIAKSVVTIVAVMVGAIWWYVEFDAFRPTKPRLNIDHTVTSKRLAGDQTWLHVQINVENVGDKRVVISEGFTRIQQVLPVPRPLAGAISHGDKSLAWASVKPWPMLAKRPLAAGFSMALEAKERAEILQEFFVPGGLTTVRIYTYLKNNDALRELGWFDVEIHDILAGKDSADE